MNTLNKRLFEGLAALPEKPLHRQVNIIGHLLELLPDPGLQELVYSAAASEVPYALALYLQRSGASMEACSKAAGKIEAVYGCCEEGKQALQADVLTSYLVLEPSGDRGGSMLRKLTEGADPETFRKLFEACRARLYADPAAKNRMHALVRLFYRAAPDEDKHAFLQGITPYSTEEAGQEGLRELAEAVMEDRDPTLIYRLNDVVRGFDTASVGLGDEDFLKAAMQRNGNAVLLGLQDAEKLYIAHAESPIDGHREWYNACVRNRGLLDEDPLFDRRLKFYHLLRQVALKPENAREWIRSFRSVAGVPEEQRTLSAVATNAQLFMPAVHGALEAILLSDKGIRETIDFIDLLGPLNGYRFTKDGELPASATAPDFAEQAMLHLQDTTFGGKQIVYIYLNTMLRSIMPVSGLMQLLEKHGTPRVSNYLKTSAVFRDFYFSGTLLHDAESDTYSIASGSFRSDPLPVHYRWLKLTGNKDLAEKLCTDGTPVEFQVNDTDMNTGIPFVTPVHDEAQALGTTTDDTDAMIRLLDVASDAGTVSDEAVMKLRAMEVSIPLPPEKAEAFHMAFARCMAALSGDMNRVMAVMNAVNYKASGRLNVFRNRREVRSFYGYFRPFDTDGNRAKLLMYWGKVNRSLSLAERHMIWSNTLFKMTVSLSELVLPFCGDSEYTVLTDKLVHYQTGRPAYFAGKLTDSGWNLYIKPVGYLVFGDRVTAEKDQIPAGMEAEDACLFTVQGYDRVKHVFKADSLVSPDALNEALGVRKNLLTALSLYSEQLIPMEKLAETASDAQDWQSGEVRSTIQPVLRTLERIAGDPDTLTAYLDFLDRVGLWKFDETDFYRNGATIFTPQCFDRSGNIVRTLQRSGQAELLLRTYFHSPVYRYVPLNEILRKLRDSDESAPDEAVSRMREITLKIHQTEAGLRGKNFRETGIRLSEGESFDPAASYVLNAYDGEKDILILTKQA